MASEYCFILPGLNNSGPEHWQTHWENEYGFTRIQQADWDNPVADIWIQTIEEKLAQFPPGQVVLIGHSLACCTIVKWAQQYGHLIKAALLVGPSDTEATSYPPGTTGFTPMPLFKMPFPSVVVASSDDFYVSMERATFFANHWGSQLTNAGPLGHINSSSDIGNWRQGYAILQKLINP
ncbi:MAG: alpha/beta fold hydrolase [Chitinophagaceae bacterium]